MKEDSSDAPIVINLTRARAMAGVRLLAVGVFLSVITITSKQLISYMRNIWKVRGTIETNQYADRRFIIEFSEEGDFEHVTSGGPWRYRDDAVLVRKLEEGEDPETAQFWEIPIWVQYKGVPFYLLSKALARNLARRTGGYICIDNNARGDICDKILRARVWLPIARPLRKVIMIEDEVSDAEVEVSLRYERLPNFCLFCGIIGHHKQNCTSPETPKRSRYSASIGVPPTSHGDLRSWPMPEKIGDPKKTRFTSTWRAEREGRSREDRNLVTRITTIVSQVAKGVEQLSMEDKRGKNKIVNNKLMIANTTSTAPLPKIATNNECTSPQNAIITVAPTGEVDKTTDDGKAQDENNPASTTSSSASFQILLDGNTTGPATTTATTPPQNAEDAEISGLRTNGTKEGKKNTWKRMLRNEERGDNTLTTRALNLGAPRKRNMLEEDEEDRLHGTKRFFQVPSLEECLGKENLQRIREEEAEAFIRGVCANGGGITDYVSVEGIGSNVEGEGNKISTDVIGKEKM
ncbi:hypothetical protein ACQ4PT_004208 [Festuca glaucescens]